MERIPILIDNHERYKEKASRDIPVLEDVVNSQWRKEDELKKLKSDLAALERKIQMTIGENSANTDMQNKNVNSQNLQVPSEKKAVEISEPKAIFRV